MPPDDSSHPLRILLVDDYAPMREVVRMFLEMLSHSVEVASTGLGAITVSRAERFDLILMDIHMPGMSGLEATARIRLAEATSGHRAHIIGYSTARVAEYWPLTAEAGMDDCLTKFEVDALERKLHLLPLAAQAHDA